MENEQKYWVWLASVPGVTPKLFYQILKSFGSAQRFFDTVAKGCALREGLPEKMLSAAGAACSESRVVELCCELVSKGVRAVTRLDGEYPGKLSALEYPPPVLFVRGSLKGLEKTIGIVGTRHCTRRGAELTRSIAHDLAQAGYTVVSGMARGIDAAAHTGALDAGAPTVAVLGCGADVIYPPENAAIYEAAVRNGAVVSELPPGTGPLAGNFPVRNRIIAALSRGLLVMESAEKGGTAITASMAIGMKRDIFAVPGAPYIEQASLPDLLIRQGAVPVSCAEDILEYWGEARITQSRAEENLPELDPLQHQIYGLLKQSDLSVEGIAEAVDAPQSDINIALTMMELSGLIRRVQGGQYGI